MPISNFKPILFLSASLGFAFCPMTSVMSLLFKNSVLARFLIGWISLQNMDQYLYRLFVPLCNVPLVCLKCLMNKLHALSKLSIDSEVEPRMELITDAI